MGLFKKRLDPLSAVAALIEATAQEDAPAIVQSRRLLDPVSTMDILYGLHQFGEMISRGLTPDNHQMITEVLTGVDGSPAVQAAIRNVVWAVLVDGTQAALSDAANTYFAPLIAEPNNLLRNTVFDIVTAIGKVCGRLDLKLNFK